MGKKIFLVTILLTLSYLSLSYAQTSCRVLLPSISGSYSGDCKRGLAEGTGQATGEDFYKGNFVKGLPEGKGTYVWKNGAKYEGEWEKGMRDGYGIYTHKVQDQDTVLDGQWKENKYLGKKAPAPYIIEYRNGIGRVTCMRTGDRPYVRYVFSRNGGESHEISELMLQGSSGSENISAAFTGFEYIEFPFHGSVRFYAPNNFYSAILTCELRLTINQPGAWIVTIFF
ncbi:MAG: hypothetical protein WAL29_10370 [Bacteroidales bacterium]